jgi:hypothetical protein
MMYPPIPVIKPGSKDIFTKYIFTKFINTEDKETAQSGVEHENGETREEKADELPSIVKRSVVRLICA